MKYTLKDILRSGKSTDVNEVEIMIYFAKLFKCRKFLEIGTCTGSFSISIARAFGVDAAIDTVDIEDKPEAKKAALAYKNINFHSCGSDEYFKQNKTKYDFIFVDGCHTAPQSKKDINNSVECLSKNGIIFIHDIRKTKKKSKDVLYSYRKFKDHRFIKFTIKTSRGMGVLLPI